MSWKEQLKQSFTDPRELLDFLQIYQVPSYLENQSQFPFLVTRFYSSLMQKGNLSCPLLRQVLPLDEERRITKGTLDPLDEKNFMLSPGFMQKFQARLLVILSGHCAINCRYCFRRNFPYQDNSLSQAHMQEQLQALKLRPEIFEVIFSGGDPLTMNNKSLARLLDIVDKTDNIKVIRFHTRLPVVLPDRLDDEFIKILASLTKKVIIVTHMNHSQEISERLKEKVSLLADKNIPVFNQAVLLKGVNDTLSAQYSLWKEGFLSGILPYYLHQLDEVKGAHHFKVEISDGQEIMRQLRLSLPGYMLPTYVQEIPHAGSKVPIV